MLQTEHRATSYAKPSFRRGTPDRRSYRQVLDRVIAIREVGGDSTNIDLSDSDAAGLDDFLRQHEAIRHELMLRRVRGESLTPVEDMVLRHLNEELEVHLPTPQRRPADVTAAVREATLILAELENGAG